jgi:hypothetical protein
MRQKPSSRTPFVIETVLIAEPCLFTCLVPWGDQNRQQDSGYPVIRAALWMRQATKFEFIHKKMNWDRPVQAVSWPWLEAGLPYATGFEPFVLFGG